MYGGSDGLMSGAPFDTWLARDSPNISPGLYISSAFQFGGIRPPFENTRARRAGGSSSVPLFLPPSVPLLRGWRDLQSAISSARLQLDLSSGCLQIRCLWSLSLLACESRVFWFCSEICWIRTQVWRRGEFRLGGREKSAWRRLSCIGGPRSACAWRRPWTRWSRAAPLARSLPSRFWSSLTRWVSVRISVIIFLCHEPADSLNWICDLQSMTEALETQVKSKVTIKVAFDLRSFH